MGVYNPNSIELVERAIKSIINQTYSNFEFIICDDGSNNDVFSLIQEYTNIDIRIKVIRHSRNYGLAKSLNDCLELAEGDYIARMDADDISKIDRFEKQLGFLENHQDYSLVGCCAELVDEKGVWGIRKMPREPKKEDFLWGSPFMHPTVMVRKSAYTELGGYRVTKETYRLEDYDFFMRAYQRGFKGYNLNEILYEFLEDKDSYKRKKYRYRLDEVKIRYVNFKKMNLLPKGLIYVAKPLIVGLIPNTLLRMLRWEKI